MAPNKPRTSKVKSDKSVAYRDYLERKEGVTKWEGLKMATDGFETGKGNGITSMYNL